MVTNSNHPNKSDRPVSNKGVKDFDSDLKQYRDLYFEATGLQPFWSGADKIVFADKWTILMQRLMSHGTSLHGLRHRLILGEDDEDFEEVSQ